MPADNPFAQPEAWREYASDPHPGWASREARLFDARSARLDEDRRCDVGVCAIPFDSTASTRIGSRGGPTAIRQASFAYSSQAASRGACVLRNMRTGRLTKTMSPEIADFGDLHIYPSNPVRQTRAAAAEVRRVATLSDRIVVLGGEHLISYPAFAGVREAAREKSITSVGYLQIDHHFDFGDTSVLHGELYHGSNARRISELEGMSPRALGFVGVGDLTRAEQFEWLCDSGATVKSMADIREQSCEQCLTDACEALLSHADALYVSIDIDVCDMAVAPGTGHVTIGGLTAAELIDMASVLRRYRVLALDIVEVNPSLDNSGRTAHLAARFLYEWLCLADGA